MPASIEVGALFVPSRRSIRFPSGSLTLGNGNRELSWSRSDRVRGPALRRQRTISFGDDRLLTIVRNITSKKRAETDLEESRRFAQRIAETSLNVLFVYDLIEQRNVYANERSTDVIGYTPKEIENMGESFIQRLMHPDDLALMPKRAAEYATRKDGEIFEHVFRMRHKNGQWRWVHRCATIFNRTADGRPKQILGSVTDMSDYKRAEQELQEFQRGCLA